MRTQYNVGGAVERVRLGEGDGSRRLAQVATIVYWVPLLSVNVWIAMSWGGRLEGLMLAGDLLFRETLIYMGFWMLVAFFQALLFSRYARERRPKRRAGEAAASKAANRGIERTRLGL